MSLDRGQVWRLFGAPTDQEGSVNDPRSQEEHGVRWNEKWIYRGEDGESIERLVLWHRYDFVGMFRIAADGVATAETLPGD